MDQPVPVHPVDTAYRVDRLTIPDGTVLFRITFFTPIGVASYFFDEEHFGAFVTRTQSVKSNLIVPLSAEVVDFVKKGRG